MFGISRLSNVLDKTFGIIEIGVNRAHAEISFHDEMYELENKAARKEKRKEVKERIKKANTKKAKKKNKDEAA